MITLKTIFLGTTDISVVPIYSDEGPNYEFLWVKVSVTNSDYKRYSSVKSEALKAQEISEFEYWQYSELVEDSIAGDYENEETVKAKETLRKVSDYIKKHYEPIIIKISDNAIKKIITELAEKHSDLRKTVYRDKAEEQLREFSEKRYRRL